MKAYNDLVEVKELAGEATEQDVMELLLSRLHEALTMAGHMAKPAFDLMIQDLIKAYIAWCLLDNKGQAVRFSDGEWGREVCDWIEKAEEILKATPDDQLEEVAEARERRIHALCADDVRRVCHHMWRAASRAAAPQDALLDSVVQRTVSPILRNLGRRLLVFRGWHHAMDIHPWACPQYYNGIRNAHSGPDQVNANMYLMPVPDCSDEE